MLEVHVAKGPTGRLFVQMLKDRGLMQPGRIKGVVNYGYHGGDPALPTLNARAGIRDKYEELVKLDKCDVQTIPFAQNYKHLRGIILGRNCHHAQGRDIKVFYPLAHAQGRPVHAMDFYTELIPKQTEFRVWVFRDKHLATYEKVLQYPERNGRNGRSKEVWNWHNGYAFEFRRGEDVSNNLKTLAMKAVDALDLDFGAVDILQGKDGHFYVLEVNTAPGTQGAARQGITSLVNCIERWAKNGFKERE